MSALGAIFAAEGEGVFGFLLARCGCRATAQDLLAETFEHAGDRFRAGRGSEVTAPWLRTVARRRLIDHWRREARSRNRLDQLRRQTAPHVDPPQLDDDDVERALASLSTRQRAALTLRYLDDFSVTEVAEALDMTYKATESLLGRAKKSFAVAYGNRASGPRAVGPRDTSGPATGKQGGLGRG